MPIVICQESIAGWEGMKELHVEYLVLFTVGSLAGTSTSTLAHGQIIHQGVKLILTRGTNLEDSNIY
jgi:hypothetical protein